jgi:ribonuclease P protein component
MKLQRLSGRKVNDYVLRRGRQWKGKLFTVSWIAGPPRLQQNQTGLFVGTFASTRLSKSAVERNRMRRRVREALRIIAKESSDIPSAQLLIHPRSASMKASFEDIVREMRTFLLQLPPWPTKNDHPVSGTSS